MEQSIYGNHRPEMEAVMKKVTDSIEDLRQKISLEEDFDPIEHLLFRIKEEGSMREKCRRKGLPETENSALVLIQDAIGIRIVCAFIDDVYLFRDHLRNLPGCEIIEEKDYIKKVKPNGYRSLHMILRVDGEYFVEVQLRTISMDTWAALEHHMKYKKDLKGNTALITAELKRCADELASTDLSMQTIRDMIRDLS